MYAMSIEKRAERLARTPTKGIEEFSVSISGYVEADPMLSTTVRRICVAYYDGRSFCHTKR